MRRAAVLLLLSALAACGGGTKWVAFTASDAHFRAEFPSNLAREVRSLSGGQLQINYSAASKDEEVIVQFTSTGSARTGADLQKLLDAQMDGSASAVTGTVTSRKNLTFLGHPAEDGVISGRQGVALRMRAFFVPEGAGDRYYVISGGAASLPAAHPAYDHLLATFKLT